MGRFKLNFLLATFYIAIFCMGVLCVMIDVLWKFHSNISPTVSDNSPQSGGCLTHYKIRENRKINLIKSWNFTEAWNFNIVKRLCFSKPSNCNISKSTIVSTVIQFWMWIWVTGLIIDFCKQFACRWEIWKLKCLVSVLDYLQWKFQRKI